MNKITNVPEMNAMIVNQKEANHSLKLELNNLVRITYANDYKPSLTPLNAVYQANLIVLKQWYLDYQQIKIDRNKNMICMQNVYDHVERMQRLVNKTITEMSLNTVNLTPKLFN